MSEISGAAGGASVGAARSRGQVVGMIGTRDTRGMRRGERDEEHGKEGGDELEVEASVRQNFQTRGANRGGVVDLELEIMVGVVGEEAE